MINQLLKKVTCYFNAINSEVSYWKQIDILQTELEKVNASLYESNQESYCLMIENDALKAEISVLKEELETSNISYRSLLNDYYLMMDKYREFKRQNHKVIADLKPLYRIVDNSVLESLGENNAI